MNNLFLNFSYKKNGNTFKMIDAMSDDKDTVMFIPDFESCYDCKTCHKKNNCYLNDNDEFIKTISIIKSFNNVYFCSPVYCNNATAKFISFISRCSMLSETTYFRQLFDNINAYIIVSTDVSGSQATANNIMSALNMLGATIPPRAVYTHVNNWQDNKIRGGNIKYICQLQQKHFKTYNTLLNERKN